MPNCCGRWLARPLEEDAMDLAHTLVFTVFPYLCLTTFVVGHAYRYVTDRYNWNARSSEFLEKKALFAGSVIFHWGIVLTFFGHAGGMLIPQSYFDLVGIDDQAHLAIAHWSGLAVGLAAFVGILLLLWRRLTHPRVRAVNTVNDTVTVLALLFVITTGLYNVLFGHHNVLYTVAPWIRGIVTFTPDATLMHGVPFSFMLHVTAAWALLAFSPFSRLVHIWSAPLFYFFRRWILFRRHPAPADTAMAGRRP
jgi:nitrate reductase gamma subunit